MAVATDVETDVASELMALERQFWTAIRDKNPSAALAVSADTCLVVGAQGIEEVDKKALAAMLESAPWELSAFDFEDVHVRTVADGVVAVAYKVKEDLVVDGKKMKLEAFDSSVWVRSKDKWLCVVHTESIAGDPFGRR